MRLLSAELVEAIHDEVLNPRELAGRARDKSLEAALARVDNRLAYGMIGDVFDLAASYAMAIARGHCFNDANKRTAFRSMQVCLHLNGVALPWVADEVGPLIVRCARGDVDEAALAEWLRERGNG
jgi:death-on-curing protein